MGTLLNTRIALEAMSELPCQGNVARLSATVLGTCKRQFGGAGVPLLSNCLHDVILKPFPPPYGLQHLCFWQPTLCLSPLLLSYDAYRAALLPFLKAGAQEFIQKRAIANFAAADADYGRLIAEKVNVVVVELFFSFFFFGGSCVFRRFLKYV